MARNLGGRWLGVRPRFTSFEPWARVLQRAAREREKAKALPRESLGDLLDRKGEQFEISTQRRRACFDACASNAGARVAHALDQSRACSNRLRHTAMTRPRVLRRRALRRLAHAGGRAPCSRVCSLILGRAAEVDRLGGVPGVDEVAPRAAVGAGLLQASHQHVTNGTGQQDFRCQSRRVGATIAL